MDGIIYNSPRNYSTENLANLFIEMILSLVLNKFTYGVGLHELRDIKCCHPME